MSGNRINNVLILAAGAGVTAATCMAEPRYFASNGHYYELVEGAIGWSAAEKSAAKRGGTLATITSEEENAFIAQQVLVGAHGLNYAIGGQQPAESPEPSGGWEWVTGESWVYTNWNSGEPNNNGVGGAEDHLMIYADASFGRFGKWNDIGSACLDGYVIEYYGGSTTFCAATGHSYGIIESPMSWESAALLAQSLGGHLATITSPAENEFIVENVLSLASGLNYAIGGMQLPGSDEPAGGWVWTTGELWNYENWNPGEPSNFGTGGVEDRLMIYADVTFGRLGKWNDIAAGTYDEQILSGSVIEYDTVVVRGDMNCDGAVNNFDTDQFVLALTDRCTYEQLWPDCDLMQGDCNADGAVNNFDIDAFVSLILRR